jgi:formate-dependent nitrite reductase membrane component NrfD
LGWTFKLGVILVGMLLPLSIIAWLPSAAIVAGGSILVGGLLFRYCILKAGVYVAFPLA